MGHISNTDERETSEINIDHQYLKAVTFCSSCGEKVEDWKREIEFSYEEFGSYACLQCIKSDLLPELMRREVKRYDLIFEPENLLEDTQ